MNLGARLSVYIDKRKPSPGKKISDKDWINYRPAVKVRPNKQSLHNYFKNVATHQSFDDITIIISIEPPVICNEFGCGKTLTILEKLCGSVCLRHSGPGDIIGKKKP